MSLTVLGRRSMIAVNNGAIRPGTLGRFLTVNSDTTEPSSAEPTPPPRHILSPYERFVVRITRSYSGSEVPTTMGYVLLQRFCMATSFQNLCMNPHFPSCSPEAMDRVNSRFRIGLMVVMMTFTLGVSLFAIRQGKREKAAHSSEMVYSKNRSRYK